MAETCADCKYHICGNPCIDSEGCNGFCKKHHTHKLCHRGRCKDYEMDGFFRSPDNLVIGD